MGTSELLDPVAVERDRALMQQWIADRPDIASVAAFRPNPHISRLPLAFDIDELRAVADRVVASFHDQGGGFHSLSVNRRPGATEVTQTDLSGRYYLRPDETYQEVAREEIVDESAYTELAPIFADTYFETVFDALRARFPIGRMRLLLKDTFNCNSWHRDPEPRLHIPIRTNPGSLFIVNHHCTHLPADGSVYFTDTRGYHTALNGGEHPRLHLVAALAFPPNAE